MTVSIVEYRMRRLQKTAQLRRAVPAGGQDATAIPNE